MAQQLGIFDVLKMIFVLLLILAGAYYATKLLAERASNSAGGKGLFSTGSALGEADKPPRVIHRMMIDRETSLVLIEYNDWDYLVAFSSGSSNVIEKRKLSEEEVSSREKIRQENRGNSFSFSKYTDRHKEIFSEVFDGMFEKGKTDNKDKGVDKIEKED